MCAASYRIRNYESFPACLIESLIPTVKLIDGSDNLEEPPFLKGCAECGKHGSPEYDDGSNMNACHRSLDQALAGTRGRRETSEISGACSRE